MLDTHYVIWLTANPEQIPAVDAALLGSPQTKIFLSTVALWEVRLKWHSFHKSGDRKGDVAPETVLLFAQAVGWSILDLTPLHAVTVLQSPIVHKDPFDELLLVQAQVEGIKLLTRDEQLIGHQFVFTP